VRITDRGPYINGRILDLSRAAAVQLGMDQVGTAHVQIEIVGQRRPELLHHSPASSGAVVFLRNEHSMAERPTPLMTSSLRVLPSDVWLTRRIRRVPAMLATDHTAHAEVATLALA
jgi:rare lipoprotein A